MLKMLVLILALTGLFSSARASLNLHGTPLFPGETSFTFDVETLTLTKKTSCYVTSGEVSQCRRKRGMEEKPGIVEMYDDLQIAPSAVLGIQPTPVARAINRFHPGRVFSSFDDTFFNSPNIFREISAKGRSNVITVGDCGLSTLNLSQFLTCLGMTVQETTTLTATFTETTTFSSGYVVMTVMGCTPAGFPYPYCPAEILNNTSSSVPNDSDTTTAPMTAIQPSPPSFTEPPTTSLEETNTDTPLQPSSGPIP